MITKSNYRLLEFTFSGYIKSVSEIKKAKNNDNYVLIDCVNFDFAQSSTFLIFQEKMDLKLIQPNQFVKIDGIVKNHIKNEKTWFVVKRMQILATPKSVMTNSETHFLEDIDELIFDEQQFENNKHIDLDDDFDLNDIAKIYGDQH